jgi:hypothetical protein
MLLSLLVIYVKQFNVPVARTNVVIVETATGH